MNRRTPQAVGQTEVEIRAPEVALPGILGIPGGAEAVVLFAHGAGSSRRSPRNRHVAEILQQASLATLLMDLLSEQEERADVVTRDLSFNIPFLAGRLEAATDWLLSEESTRMLRVGYFGASTGAAAALVAAARRPQAIGARWFTRHLTETGAPPEESI
jgi:dienelactone hydrolase